MAKRSKKVIAKLEEAEAAAKKGAKRARKAVSKAGVKARKTGKSWLDSARRVDEDDVRHVVERGVDEADDFIESAQHWLVKLGKRIRLLYDMLVAWWTGRFDFPKATVVAITLALLYFINPFDLIPDEIPVVGVLDDAMVFALVTRMMHDDLVRYSKKFGVKLSDLGLTETRPRRR
jgi:uncharacterized membrane protein YkvA (DUF1232 family)